MSIKIIKNAMTEPVTVECENCKSVIPYTYIEMDDCIDSPFEYNGETIHTGCGGTKCVEVHYRKNPMTLEWQIAWGECKKCGRRFIV